MNPIIKIIDSFLKEGQKGVLELGCGNGDLISLIGKGYPHLKKIVAADYFNEPKDLPNNIRFIKQNIENLQLNDTFDLVILNQVFEHMKNPLGLIEKIKTILNKNGRILIIVPNRYGFDNEAKIHLPEHGKHYFIWDKDSLQFSLERLGFICRFYNLFVAASHNKILKYIPAILRIQNPNLTCVAMLDHD